MLTTGVQTLTIALLSGSPALNKGDPLATSVDQRSFSRPLGGGFDSGAFESDLASIPPAAFFHNSKSPGDVNDDGRVTPIDALMVINFLNRVGGGAVDLTDFAENDSQSENSARPRMVDVTGDGKVTAIDALRIINSLSRRSTEAELTDMAFVGGGPLAEGEGISNQRRTDLDDEIVEQLAIETIR